MSLPRRILVVVDAAMRQTAATRRGVEMARRSGARLHLLMPAFDSRIDATAELVDPEVERLARQQYIDQRQRWLAEWSAGLADQGLDVVCEVVWARALHEAVIAVVLDLAPDLVIKDLVHESLLRRWTMVRSADWRLARLCPAPLMLVQEGTPSIPIRIAAAVDPSHPRSPASGLDDRVVQSALPLAMLFGAEIELIHVFPGGDRGQPWSAELGPAVDQLHEEDAEAFNQLADRYSVPAERRTLLEGDPVMEVLKRVENGRSGLLVLGSQYQGGLSRLFLGSHAEAFIAQAECDLLLVRPEGFIEELRRHHALDAFDDR